MCEPFSAALMIGGSIAQGIAQGQIAGAQKKSIRQNAASYEAERGRQAGYQAENMGTFGDTLANYSRPKQDAMMVANTEKRQATYTSPFNNRDFTAAGPADYDPNSVVAARNAQTGAAAKEFALGQAMAKAVLDAFGDTQVQSNIYSANNANKMGTVNRIAGTSANAERVQQGTLQSKLEADKSAGGFMGGLGDLLSAAGMMAGMGGGFGSFGSKLPATSFAPVTLSNGMSVGGTIGGANIAGSGLFGSIERAFAR